MSYVLMANTKMAKKTIFLQVINNYNRAEGVHRLRDILIKIYAKSTFQPPFDLDVCAHLHFPEGHAQDFRTEGVVVCVYLKRSVDLGILVCNAEHMSQALATQQCIFAGFGLGVCHCCYPGCSEGEGFVGVLKGEAGDANVAHCGQIGCNFSKEILICAQVAYCNLQDFGGLLTDENCSAVGIVVDGVKIDGCSLQICSGQSQRREDGFGLGNESIDI